jgi:hypothetical protein
MILRTAGDLAALDRAVRDGGLGRCGPVSVQIETLDPNLALAAQRAINGGCAATGWPEAMAAAVVLAGLAAGGAVALEVGHGVILASDLGVTALAGAGGGAFLGRALGLFHARRRAARALALLCRHAGHPQADAPRVGRGEVLPPACGL